MELETNVLYYGDNLHMFRNHIPDESVDLPQRSPFAEAARERERAKTKRML